MALGRVSTLSSCLSTSTFWIMLWVEKFQGLEFLGPSELM